MIACGARLTRLQRACAARKTLAVARDQQAKSWEAFVPPQRSRACWRAVATGLKHWHCWTPIHRWFTEGGDTKDVKEAAKLFLSFEMSRVHRENLIPC